MDNLRDDVGPIGLRPHLSSDLVVSSSDGKFLAVSRSMLMHHCLARQLPDTNDLICKDIALRLKPHDCLMSLYDGAVKNILRFCEFSFFSPLQSVYRLSPSCSLLVSPQPVEYYNPCDSLKRTLNFANGLYKVCLTACPKITSPYVNILQKPAADDTLLAKPTNVTHLYTALAGTRTVASLLHKVLSSGLHQLPAAVFSDHDWIQELIPDFSDLPAAFVSLSLTVSVAAAYCLIRRCVTACPSRTGTLHVTPVTLQRRRAIRAGSPLP